MVEKVGTNVAPLVTTAIEQTIKVVEKIDSDSKDRPKVYGASPAASSEEVKNEESAEKTESKEEQAAEKVNPL